MRLTDRTDHAFRVLTYLTAGGERLTTVREIADRYHASRGHLSRVVWELGRAGLVETVRDNGGGLRLACPTEPMPLGAVARRTERTIPLAECFPGGAGGCRITPVCQYRAVPDDAGDAFFSVLDPYSVLDLVGQSPELRGFVLADPS